MYRWFLPLAFALIACPSPPEDGEEGAGQGQGQGQGAGGGGGEGGPAGQGGGGAGEGKLDPTTGTRCNTAEAESAAQAVHSQAELEGMDHVTFSGTIGCDGCTTNLILQATEQIDQSSTPPEGGPKMLTSTTVSAGSYTLLVPRSSSAIVLELVGDADGNGSATAGEWFGVQDGQGQNVADQNRSVDINVTLCAGGEAATTPAPTQTNPQPPQGNTPPPQEDGPAGPEPTDPPPPPEANNPG